MVIISSNFQCITGVKYSFVLISTRGYKIQLRNEILVDDSDSATMDFMIFLLYLSPWIAVGSSDSMEPSLGDAPVDTNKDKDMYVIHATVYQVGILTNKTDDESIGNITGNQEAITLYQTNGSNIDLSNIPTPLLTNITAQRLVGVAPTEGDTPLPWSALNNLVAPKTPTENSEDWRHNRQVVDDENNQETENDYKEDETYDSYRPTFLERLLKRSLSEKQDVEKTPVKVVSGSSVIPEEAGVHSIAIPPLITLNNNLSEIPVPIPNTAVVSYSKINTLVHGT